MRVLVLAGLVVLTGCASSKEYTSYLVAHQAAHESRTAAEKARYAAIAEIAKTSPDAAARTAAVMALAMGKSEAQVAPPAPPPQNQALQWASVLVPALTNVATGYYGYQLGVAQSNNNRDATVAGYNAFGSIATGGFAALQNTSVAGFNSNASLASFIQAPQPNMTLSGTGVLGSGSYSNTTTTTTNTNTDSNNTSRNCQGGAGAAGGAGGGTTTGAAGGNGAAGGGATC
jgi:hypothetical protein